MTDIVEHINQARDELVSWEKRIKQLEKFEEDLNGQVASLQAKLDSLSKQLKEKTNKLSGIESREALINEREKSLSEAETMIQKEKELDRERKIRLDSWENELKLKAEKVKRILSG